VSDFLSGEYMDLPKRGLREDTLRHFGYFVAKKGTGWVQVAPYYRDGVQVAQHVRTPTKDFFWVGDSKKVELFGQHLWRDGGKMVVVTEGEIDAMSVSQLQGNKWPVVSIPGGAPSAKRALADNIEFLEKFEKVILMFDMDDPGRKAAEEAAQVLSPGRAFVARLPAKDPNELLQAGRGAEVISAMWDAKQWRPDGVVDAFDLIDEVLKPLPIGDAWCFPTMNAWTYGRRPGEVYAFGAGTGVGKTDFFTQQIAFDLMTLQKKVGVLYLEQNPKETLRRIAGKAAGRVLHTPDGYSPEELRAAVDTVASDHRLVMFNHFGVTDWDLIKQRIRYMVVSLECEHIFLDHLTALVAQEDDERKALDSIMAELAGQAQELGHKLHLISHLTTPEGKPHEEGGRVMIRHFRGSRAIGFWSHFVFGLERSQQDDDEYERSITTLRCLKDRPTGRGTGKTLRLKYSQETGLLTEEEDDASGGF
jgi:twinkle protein